MILELKRTPGIYLVGFMGSGKSTVGKMLSDKIGWPFVDVDERAVEQRVIGPSIGRGQSHVACPLSRTPEMSASSWRVNQPIQRMSATTPEGFSGRRAVATPAWPAPNEPLHRRPAARRARPRATG